MTRFCINSPEDEKKVTNEILQTLAHYMTDCDININYLTEIKLQKIVYRTIEELELPITRSWYLRGCMVHPGGRLSGFITKDKVKKSMEYRHFIFDEDIYACFDNIQVVNRIFKVKGDKFLKDLYDSMKPERYRVEYIPNNEILLSLKRTSVETFDISETISNNISRLTLGLYGDDIFDSIPNSFYEFLELMENTFIEIETIVEEGAEISSECLKFIKLIDNNYYNVIWKLPATIISIDTVEGLSAETLIKSHKNYIPYGIEEIERTFENLNEKSQELNLTLNEKNIEKAYNTSLEKIGVDSAKNIIEMFKIYAK